MTVENSGMEFPLVGLAMQYWRPNFEAAQVLTLRQRLPETERD